MQQKDCTAIESMRNGIHLEKKEIMQFETGSIFIIALRRSGFRAD
jgi:hypothetical protein